MVEEAELSEEEAVLPLFSLSQEASSRIAKQKVGRPNIALQSFFENMAATSDRDVTNSSAQVPVPEFVFSHGSHSQDNQHIEIETDSGLGPSSENPIGKDQIEEPQLFQGGEFWQRHSRHGLAPANCLTMALVDLAKGHSNIDLDPAVIRLADRFLQPGFHLTSVVTLEKETKIDRKGQALRLSRLACALFILQRHHMHQFEQQILECTSRAGRLLYLEYSSYDETPMLTRVQQRPLPNLSVPVDHPDLLPSHLAVLSSLQRGVSLPSLSSSAKLLQVKLGTGMLVKHDDKILFFQVDAYNHLPAMGRNSAEVLRQCLSDMAVVGEASTQFKHRCRAIVADQAKSNVLCEQGLLTDRGCVWSSLVQSCGVHNVSAVHNKVFEVLFPDAVTGLIRTSLAVRQGGKFPMFRQVVLEVVKDRLEVLRGACSTEARLAREELLTLFVGQQKYPWKSFLLLNTALNGDWRVGGTVQHYVPYGVEMPKKEHIEELISNALLLAVLTHQPTIWPRHRWTGSEEAVSQMGIFLIIHSLLLPVFQKFSDMCKHTGKIGQIDTVRGVAEAQEPAEGEEAFPLSTTQVLPIEEAQVSDENIMLDHNLQDASHAIRNSKMRSEALQWLSTNPLPKLLIMKVVLRPLSELMHALLRHAGAGWEDEQRAKVASARMGCGEDFCKISRIELAARGELETAFYQKIEHTLGQHSLWPIFPADFSTMHWRALAFKAIIKSGASIFQLFAWSHNQFPLKLWRLLKEPDLAGTLEAQPACLRDPFSQKMFETFGGFRGSDFAGVLEAISLTVATDISQIECRHASIRRCLTAHSVQTWRMGLVMAAAHWILQNVRVGSNSRRRQKRKDSQVPCGSLHPSLV